MNTALFRCMRIVGLAMLGRFWNQFEVPSLCCAVPSRQRYCRVRHFSSTNNNDVARKGGLQTPSPSLNTGTSSANPASRCSPRDTIETIETEPVTVVTARDEGPSSSSSYLNRLRNIRPELRNRLRTGWRTAVARVQQSTATVRHKVQDSARQTASKFRSWIQSQVQRTRDRLTSRAQQWVGTTQARVRAAPQHLRAFLTTTVSNATQRVVQSVTTRPVREASRTIVPKGWWDTPSDTTTTGTMSSTSVVSRWWNSFWWWSLAAIGVYGITTTVPKEWVRQRMSSRQHLPAAKQDVPTKTLRQPRIVR